ncbi:MAG: DUF4402 domain-containing protein [Phenylobacterium sp.]|nr:DUF4402 domain-containing protein [Phenylobacterium sp.]
MRRLVLIALLALAAPAAGRAATFTLNVTGAMDLGSVGAASSGDTVFRVDPVSGSVSVVSGGGRRISTASARVQVNITCKPSRSADTDCTTRNVRIQMGRIGSLTGRARAFSAFYAASGTATIVTPPTGAVPTIFELAPLGDNSQKNFFVGADFPVAGDDSGLASGNGENAFFVYVVDANGLMVVGDTDKGRIKAFRALAVSKTADLSFGRIQRPTSGASTVTLNANNGNRTITGNGNAVAFATPAPTRAAFTITGEGGQQISLSVPATISLTGPATLPVSITKSGATSPSLNSGLGNAGSFSFTVGGSFTLAPTTPVGSYSGTLTVTVDYN